MFFILRYKFVLNFRIKNMISFSFEQFMKCDGKWQFNGKSIWYTWFRVKNYQNFSILKIWNLFMKYFVDISDISVSTRASDMQLKLRNCDYKMDSNVSLSSFYIFLIAVLFFWYCFLIHVLALLIFFLQKLGKILVTNQNL